MWSKDWEIRIQQEEPGRFRIQLVQMDDCDDKENILDEFTAPTPRLATSTLRLYARIEELKEIQRLQEKK